MFRVKISILFILIAFFSLFIFVGSVSAEDFATDPPSRQTEIVVPYVEYEWWLLRWSDNAAACRIIVEHEGLPNDNDIYIYCGDTIFQEWLDTKACEEAVDGESTSDCNGLYFLKIATEPLEKRVQIELPLPEAWLSIEGCNPVPPDNICSEMPKLVISAVEPLPNEYITQIQGTYNDIPFVCDGDICEVPLRPTLDEGVAVTFWADSSFGDHGEHYSARIRVVDAGVVGEPEGGNWYVDVMSDRWLGYDMLGCGPIWQSFPPVGGPPDWLASPDWTDLLSTNVPYTYLAGRLISQGIVDASDCVGGGLESNGYANPCGLEIARAEVDLWQNRFDEQIVDVAQKTGIPAQLIKNLFAKESQFWPGSFNGAEEYGLGQLTSMGADTVLLWNTAFYNQFCPFVLNLDVCNQGYAHLNLDEQALLRGALAIRASSTCEDCPAGIDLNHANFSVDLFAETILANCQQVGQIVENARGKPPGEASSYEDLWRFTLANYNGGAGCLSTAVYANAGKPLNWANVAEQLAVECPGVREYVESIAKSE